MLYLACLVLRVLALDSNAVCRLRQILSAFAFLIRLSALCFRFSTEALASLSRQAPQRNRGMGEFSDIPDLLGTLKLSADGDVLEVQHPIRLSASSNVGLHGSVAPVFRLPASSPPRAIA